MDSFWDRLARAVAAEFTDLAQPELLAASTVRLLVAATLGGVIGYERELREHTAGLRTHMLVGVGSALMVVAPLHAGVSAADLTRVLQGIVAGIGFLGAGAILKGDHLQVRGLTTAASIWVTCAIGITAGMGREATAILATLLTVVILRLLGPLSRHLKRRRRPARTHRGEGG